MLENDKKSNLKKPKTADFESGMWRMKSSATGKGWEYYPSSQEK